MLITKPGKVNDRIWLLGRKESLVFILKGGDEFAFIGGGMVHIAPEVIEQLKAFNIDERKIKRIFILHSHFDHCGLVPFLKRRWPWAVVTASERAKTLLETPKVVDSIRFLNQRLIVNYRREAAARDLELDFDGIEVEEIVSEGDRISCGDRTLQVIEVPGHSSCSIALYLAQEKALFASDAGGIPFGKSKIFSAANSNFDQYLESLEKLSGLDVELFLPEHHAVIGGETMTGFFDRSLASALETRELIESTFARSGDVAQSTEELTDAIMKRLGDPILPREVFSLVIGQMVRFVAKKSASPAG